MSLGEKIEQDQNNLEQSWKLKREMTFLKVYLIVFVFSKYTTNVAGKLNVIG